MPAAVISNQGLVRRLAASLDRPLFARLFRNDAQVLPGSVLADFQQAAFPGYADIDLTGMFTAPILDPLGRAVSQIPALTWTRGAGGVPETIYGWLVYDDPDPGSTLFAGKRLTVPQTLTAAGQTVTISILVFLLRG